MLQILRKSDCQQITLHRIPTIPPYGDAGLTAAGKNEKVKRGGNAQLVHFGVWT